MASVPNLIKLPRVNGSSDLLTRAEIREQLGHFFPEDIHTSPQGLAASIGAAPPFYKMASGHWNNASWHLIVCRLKRKPPLQDDNKKHFRQVDVEHLRFSQKPCKDKFQCGRKAWQLVDDLTAGKHVARSHPLILVASTKLLPTPDSGPLLGLPTIALEEWCWSADFFVRGNPGSLGHTNG